MNQAATGRDSTVARLIVADDHDFTMSQELDYLVKALKAGRSGFLAEGRLQR
jgi:hypothetical protein